METLNMAAPVIPAPLTLAEWQGRIPILREKLWKLLGDIPALFTPQVKITDRRQYDRYTLEKITFDNNAGAVVYGYVLIPDGLSRNAPAILYHHMHGDKYHVGKEELFQDWLCGTQPGPALVRAGYVVLAIDAYGFGERWHQGPWGVNDYGANTEQALFKKFLWEGRSLWGMMVRDDMLALNYLLSRPEVDTARIGVTGMSLGGSRTTWMGALDDRPKVVIPVAQMTRYRNFLAEGNLNQHSVYYYLPGVLKLGIEMELLTSLAAPRPQAILIGDSDPLSPLEGVQLIIDFTRHVYGLYEAGSEFVGQLFPGVAHKYTPPMFTAMIEALQQYL